MTAQTSYELKQPLAYAGLIYANSPSDIISRSVETVAGIGFGVAGSRGTDVDNQVVVGGTDYIGVTVRDLSKEGAANTGAIQYNETETAALMQSGSIWAICPTGCVAGALVFYNDTTGILDAGTAGAGETQLDGAFWVTSAVAGQLAVIRLAGLVTTAGS